MRNLINLQKEKEREKREREREKERENLATTREDGKNQERLRESFVWDSM